MVYLRIFISKEIFIYYFMMYNFKDNILKLSKTQDLDELKNEWVIVNDKPYVKNVVCVCRKNIAYFHIFHN